MLKYILATLCVATLAHAEPRDGSHDFDFEVGKWKLHVRKLEHPLSGQQKWLDYSGTATTRPIWSGKGQVSELDIETAQGAHIEGFTLRTYSPASHQWYLYWASAKAPKIDVPTVGEFKGDRGEFYDQEMFDGRMILVRYIWSAMTKTSAHFAQSFSIDGGTTWEPNWIADQTRVE